MTDSDRNFDDLARRFKRNVYDRLKGDIRLAVLQRDLREFLGDRLYRSASDPGVLQILDAGGGQGQFSLSLAQQGHSVVICDLSREMLSIARENAARLQVIERTEFHHGAIQGMGDEHRSGYDLVLCHAVLEWVVEPQALLEKLIDMLRPGGYLSLTFYNVNSIIMKNLLRTNFDKVLKRDYRGYRGSLTPTWPRQVEQVKLWMSKLPLEELCCSGIRCFHDYLLQPEERMKDAEKQLALELSLSRQEPWRLLARYIHVFSRKSLA